MTAADSLLRRLRALVAAPLSLFLVAVVVRHLVRKHE